VVVEVVLLFVPGSGAGGDDFGSNLLSQEVFRGEQFFLIIMFFIIEDLQLRLKFSMYKPALPVDDIVCTVSACSDRYKEHL